MMSIMHRSLMVVGMFLSSQGFSADLLQIYREALLNDPQYAGSKAAFLASNEKATQGRASLLPQIGIGGSYTQNEVTGPTPRYSVNSYTVKLSQSIFNWGNWQNNQIGKLQSALGEVKYAQSSQELILRVAQAYFDVLEAEDNLAATLVQKKSIAEQLASAKRNFEIGAQTITDTHEAQSRYDLIVAQVLSDENALEIKRTALQHLVGRSPIQLSRLKQHVNIEPPNPPKIDEWVRGAEADNLGVVQARLSRQAAERNVEKSRSGHYPTVDLIASSGYSNNSQASPNSDINGRSSTIGVRWNIPIFDGMAVSSQVRESLALEQKSLDDLEDAKRAAAQSARQSYLLVHNGLVLIKALEAAEISSKSSLKSNQVGYQVGVRINIDVLNAQQQLYIAQQKLAKARYDTILSSFRLKAVAGNLTQDDVIKVNGLLEPR